MATVHVNMDALLNNLNATDDLMRQHGATWTLVTKALCGWEPVLEALFDHGVRSVADSRLENLASMNPPEDTDLQRWYLKVAEPSLVERVIAHADFSLQSELSVIEALNDEARRQETRHGIVIMIEMGDLREGILPGSIVSFYRKVFNLSNIDVLGIGANLGCMAGVMPTVDQYQQLALYHELLELKFEHRLPVLSAGTTVTLPLIENGTLPKAINHFRVGEAVLLGSDLVNGGTLQGFRQDAFTVEAEIVELKEKSRLPSGPTSPALSPFKTDSNQAEIQPGSRGWRALISLGQLDAEIGTLTPEDEGVEIAGASSDLIALNLSEDMTRPELGATVRFNVGYGSIVRLMSSPYVEKDIVVSDAAGKELDQILTLEEPRSPIAAA